MKTTGQSIKKRKTFLLTAMVLAGIILSAVAFIKYPMPLRNSLPSVNSIPKDEGILSVGTIPSFTLTDQNGQLFSGNKLSGKLWVANFIFTRCDVTCPLMTGLMASVQDAFRSDSAIRFISFSVDPEFDTPEKLKDYAVRFHAERGQWFFLTGDKATIHSLSQKYFFLPAGDVTEEEKKLGVEIVLHSDRFALVGPEGKILKYYHGTEQGTLVSLIHDINILKKTITVQ